MSFEAPKNQIIEPAKGFKAPTEDIVEPSQEAQAAPETSFLDSLNSRVANAAQSVVPALALPEMAVDVAERGIDEIGKRWGGDRPGQESTPYTPRTGDEPGLESPTGQRLLENANIAASGFYAPALVRDVASLGMKGVKAIKGVMDKKKALEAFIKQSKLPPAEGVPTVPLSAEPVTELSHATSNKAAKSIMSKGFDLSKKGTGADSIQDVKGFMGEGVSMAKKPGVATANVEGNLAKSETSLIKSYVPEKDVLKVSKESHPEAYDALINPDPTVSKPVAESILTEAKQKGFKAVSFPDGETVVTDVNAIRRLSSQPLVDKTKQLEFPLQDTTKGITFNKRQTGEIEKQLKAEVPKVQPSFEKPTTGASTDITPKSPMVPMQEPHKAISRATDDIMREPISPPSGPAPTQPLLPGAEARIKDFQDIPSTTIDPRNPLTSRAELNKKVGKLEKTATDQWLAGVQAENKAIEAGLNDKAGLQKITTIQPDSLESQALFAFIENPDKMQAYGQLASTVGRKEADDIAKAEFYIRGKLDAILPEVNKVREANGLPPIAHREDYITHMNETNILATLNKLDLLGTKEGEELAKGIIEAEERIRTTNPNLYAKIKNVVFPYIQRKNEEHATDAISAFNRYMDNAHRYIQTQPYVNELINSASAVESTNPNLARYLREQANHISGGSSPIDKAAEMVLDKDLIRLATQLQNNAKGNVIALNPSVPITQLFGLMSTVGKYPVKDSLGATMRSFADPSLQRFALANSPVLQTRALQAADNELMAGPVARQSAKLIAWFDYKVAEISWMAAFKNAIRNKPMDEALNEANEWMAITQSHLGRVSTPPMMQSKVVQTVLPLMNQQVAAARSMLLHTFKDKTLTEKGVAAAKIFAYGSAVAALKSAVTGNEDNPLSPTNVLPFGGVLERGMGGPVFNAASRVATAKSQEDLIRQLVRGGFLIQNKIPGGATVGRIVENAVMGEPRKRKK